MGSPCRNTEIQIRDELKKVEAMEKDTIHDSENLVGGGIVWILWLIVCGTEKVESVKDDFQFSG